MKQRDSGTGVGRRGASPALWLALLAAIALPAAAGARGLFGAGKVKAAATAPAEQFVAGVLQGGYGGGWVVAGRRVSLAADCVVVVNGQATGGGRLREGLDAAVIGRMVRDTMVASCVTAADPVAPGPRIDGDPNIQWSTEDPTVGWGQRPD